MKNKGFTLIELLAVILILSLLTTLAVTSVTKLVRDSRENLYLTQIKGIEAAAENWAADNLGRLPEDNKCIYVTLKGLQYYGVVDGDIKDPRDNSKIPEDLKIRITAISKENALTKYKYEAGADVTSCTEMHLEPYKAGEIVYFDVSSGTSCTEERYEASEGEYSISKYVENSLITDTVTDYGNSKSEYNGIDNKDSNQNSCLMFYVLNDNDTYVDLILDHNTTISSTWNEENEGYGPVEVLDQLKEDTKDWKGVRSIPNYEAEINYYDAEDNEDVTINYTVDYSDSKARLITVEDIDRSLDISVLSTNMIRKDGISTSDIAKNQGWLYDRLNSNHGDVINFGVPHLAISTIEDQAYWTANFKSVSSAQMYAYAVNKSGKLTEYATNYHYGVRPVIEVSKNNLY